jgi:HPt (histidine-containing phosphotransfer) domain-containing protein
VAELFLPTLASLLEEFDSVGLQLRDDLAAGAPRRAAGRLHKLRGAAGHVGARELARLAGRLEGSLLRSLDDPAAEEPWDRILSGIEQIDLRLSELAQAAAPWLEGAAEDKAAGRQSTFARYGAVRE